MGSTIVQIDKLSIRIIKESDQMISVEAVVEVSYPINAKERRRERFLSDGFCGIDPESKQKSLLMIAGRELTELKRHLEKFYIDTTPFSKALFDELDQRKHTLVIGQEVLIWSRD